MLLISKDNFSGGEFLFIPSIFNILILMPLYYLIKYFSNNKKVIYGLPVIIVLIIVSAFLMFMNDESLSLLIKLYFKALVGLFFFLSFTATMLIIYLLDKKALNQAKKKFEEV